MSDDATAEPTQGFFQGVPMALDGKLTATGMVGAGLPWGAPGLLAVVGTWPDENDEPGLVVAYEWPAQWMHVDEPLDKPRLEGLHLYRFSTDHRLATGTPAFGAAAIGADPPDFNVETDQGVLGLDCSAYTVQERRHAQALFSALRRRLPDAGPHTYRKLAGHMVHLWFPEPDRLARPFARGDESAVDELVHALRSYEPNTAPLMMAGGEFPQQMPDLGTVTTTAGATFYAAPLVGSAPDTPFFTYLGFEIGLTYTTQHRRASAWAEVRRLVSQHDRPGVDVLLLSAGAPNRHGTVFPSEEVVAHLLIEHPQALTAPTHLREIVLHLWGTGEVHALYPEVERRFGPIYEGAVPAHRPLKPPPAAAPADGPEPPADETGEAERP